MIGVPTSDTIAYTFHQETLAGSCLLSASSNAEADFPELSIDLLDESTRDLLAEKVLSIIEIPFLPGSVVEFVVNWVVKAMASDLSPETTIRLNVMLEAENTITESDDASWDDRDALATDIADEISVIMDVPILSKDQETEILRRTVKAALAVLATSGDEFREARVAFSLNAAQNLLEGTEGQRNLAKVLNAQLDMPFLGEKEEQDLLMKILGYCTDVLQSLLPQELVMRLKGESNEGLKEIKDHLASCIDDRIEIGVLVPRDKKLWVIEKVVDSVVDVIVGDTEMELFFMDDEERRNKLLDLRKSLEYEAYMNRKLFEKQQEAMARRIDRINQKLEDC